MSERFRPTKQITSKFRSFRAQTLANDPPIPPSTEDPEGGGQRGGRRPNLPVKRRSR